MEGEPQEKLIGFLETINLSRFRFSSSIRGSGDAGPTRYFLVSCQSAISVFTSSMGLGGESQLVLTRITYLAVGIPI